MAIRLDEIPVEGIAQAQQAALMRLHLKVTGDTHRILGEFVNNCKALILAAAGEDGKLRLDQVIGLEQEVRRQWKATSETWAEMFLAARRVAAWLPQGQLARLHAHVFDQVALEEQIQVGLSYPQATEGNWTPVYFGHEPSVRNAAERTRALVDRSAALRYSDGKTLSQRIWKWHTVTDGRVGSAIRNAAVHGESAWDLAQWVEQYVRPSARCPRWTSVRLRLTKTQIAEGDLRGLISGSPCESKGVAYTALRMARNEIQIVHQMATDEILGAMPWVEWEQIILSPSHPPIGCECEDVVAGGPKGDGTYAKGTIVLPLHVQCLCHKNGVLIPMEDFTRKARAWMRGEGAWAEMDRYAEYLGFAGGGPWQNRERVAQADVEPLGTGLLLWLEGDEEALEANLQNEGHLPTQGELGEEEGSSSG